MESWTKTTWADLSKFKPNVVAVWTLEEAQFALRLGGSSALGLLHHSSNACALTDWK